MIVFLIYLLFIDSEFSTNFDPDSFLSSAHGGEEDYNFTFKEGEGLLDLYDLSEDIQNPEELFAS
jgi:hypothetical protein